VKDAIRDDQERAALIRYHMALVVENSAFAADISKTGSIAPFSFKRFADEIQADLDRIKELIAESVAK
jgi:hypothetical protein